MRAPREIWDAPEGPSFIGWFVPEGKHPLLDRWGYRLVHNDRGFYGYGFTRSAAKRNAIFESLCKHPNWQGDYWNGKCPDCRYAKATHDYEEWR